MSESNRVSIRVIEESTWGVLPTTPAMQAMRHTDQNLAHAIGSKGSSEIRADRNTADSTATDKKANGGFKFEFSPDSFDQLISAALCNNWADATTTQWAATTARSLGDLCVPTVANGNYYEITTAGTTGASAPTFPLIYGATVVDGTATWTCRGPVSGVRSGVLKRSFSIEKAMLDINQFFLYSGMIINSMDLSIRAGEPITGSFDFLGRIPTAALSQATNSDSVTAATTTTVLNAIGNVGSLLEGGAAMTGVYLQEVSFKVNNNLRARTAISYDSAISVGLGSCEITGTIVAYFESNELYDKFLANTETSLVVPLSNADGSYLIQFPRIKFESDQDSGGTINTDVMERINFRCLYDATMDAQIKIGRIIT